MPVRTALSPLRYCKRRANGPRPYRELSDLCDEVAAELGLSDAGAFSIERFNLANGAEFFPAPPSVRVFPTGFRFPEAAPTVWYMASGPLWAHLGEAAQDAAIRQRAVTVLRDRVEAAIRRDEGFNVHSESGFFTYLLFFVAQHWGDR